MNRKSSRWTLLAALALAVALLLPAGAQGGVRGGLAQISFPAENAVVAATGTGARLVVRLDRGAHSFRATLDGRAVTGRFKARGRLRTARLRLRPGPHSLHVHVRSKGGHKGFAARHFLVARRSAGLLSASVRPLPRAAGSVRVTVRVKRRGAAVRLWLNGRRVDGRLPRHGRVRSAVLAGDEGLRFGPNRVRALAFLPRGVYDVARSSVRIRRTKPIPAAGRERRALLGRGLRLDGRAARAARGGLRYRWRIVRAPRAAQAGGRGATAAARLLKASSPRPVLLPKALGTYRLEAVVTDTATGTSAADTTTVEAAPDAPPIGVPIETVDGGQGGVSLGAPLEATYRPPNPQSAFQLLVLDRSTLALRSNTSFGGGPEGALALLQAIGKAGNDSLMVLTTPNPAAVSYSGEALIDLTIALERIGVPATDLGSAGAGMPFSAIGVPGGSGVINPGLTLGTPGSAPAARSSLRGYLQLDSQRNFTYVSPDYVSFDTVAAGTAPTRAVIEVGGQRYSSQPVETPGGFFVLVLDAGTLALRDEATFPVVGGRSEADVERLRNMGEFLAGYSGDRSALVFTQSIGSVARNDGGASLFWEVVAAEEQALGSHALLFNALPYGGKGDYSRVGPGARDSDEECCTSPWAKTASFASTRSAGRLTGTLARNPRSQYYPALAGPLPAPSNSLPSVAYQAPASGPLPCPDSGQGASAAVPGTTWSESPPAWPCRDTPARQAALACVGQALDLTLPIERNYWFSGGVPWSAKQEDLAELSYGSLPKRDKCESAAFGATDFAAVQRQLLIEFEYVETLIENDTSLIPHLKAPLTESSTSDYANIEQIATEIQESVKPPPSSVSVNPLELLAELLDVGAELTPEDEEAEFVGRSLGIWGASLFLASDVTDKPDGSEVVDTEIETTATQLGKELSDSYAAATAQLDHVGDLLVSDWGKLRTAALAAGSGGAWNWEPETTNTIIDGVTNSTEAQAYEELFPLAYTAYSLVDNSTPGPEAAPGSRGPGEFVPARAEDFLCAKTGRIPPFKPFSYNVFPPFRNEPANGQFQVVQLAGFPPSLIAFGRNDHYFLSGEDAPSYEGTPPAKLLNGMFGTSPPDPEAPLGPVRYLVDTAPEKGIPQLTNNGPPRSVANNVTGTENRLFGTYCTVNGRR